MRLFLVLLVVGSFFANYINAELSVFAKKKNTHGKYETYKYHEGNQLKTFSMVNSVAIVLKENTTDNSENNFIALAGNDSYDCNTNKIGYKVCKINNQLSTGVRKVLTCSVSAYFVIVYSKIEIVSTSIDSKTIPFNQPNDAAVVISKIKDLQTKLEAIQKLISCVEIPKIRYSSSASLMSSTAIPLYTIEHKAIVSASEIGKGKFLFFGNTGYISMFTNKLNEHYNTFRQIANAVFGSNNGSEKNLVALTKSASIEKLSAESDIILLNGEHSLTEEQISQIIAKVKAGAGLIVFITGYSIPDIKLASLQPLFSEAGIFPRKDLAIWSAQPTDRLKTCGLDLLTNETFVNTQFYLEWIDKSFDVFSNGFHATDVDDYPKSMQEYIKSKWIAIMQKYKPFIASIVPCSARVISSMSQKKVIVSVSTVYASQLFANTNKTAMFSSTYPGWTEAATNKKYKTVGLKFECKFSEKVPTGFYIKPGSTIEINYVTGDSKDFEIHVNTNLFDIRNKANTDEDFKKWPFTRSVVKLKNLSVNKKKFLYSAFGGLIFVKCEQNKSLEFTVSDVYEVPYYDTTYQSTITNWPTRKLLTGSHWAVIGSQYTVLTIPSDYARTIEDPSKGLEYHDKCLSHSYHLLGKDVNQQRRQFASSDVQILLGFMHSGYPVGMFVSSVDGVLNETRLALGSWGMYHEYGHNLVAGRLLYEGSSETINNIISLLCEQENSGQPPFSLEAGMLHKKFKSYEKYFKNEASINQQTLGAEHFVHLGLHANLIDAFGWELYRQAFRKLHNVTEANMKTDEGKIAHWCLILSEITGFNLIPYFKFFGLNVNKALVPDLDKYPLTLPKSKVVDWFPNRAQQIAKLYPTESNLIKPASRITEIVGPYTFKPQRIESQIMKVVSMA